MGTQYIDGISFITEQCCRCGIAFAMTKDFHDKRVQDKLSFSCPAGHSQHYIGKTNEQKLREQLANEKSISEAAKARAIKFESERKQVTKAHLKMRERVMNGVCPCCNRTFQNLMKHMQTQHLDELNIKNIRIAYGMTQALLAEEIGISPMHVSLLERDMPVADYAKEAAEYWIVKQGTHHDYK